MNIEKKVLGAMVMAKHENFRSFLSLVKPEYFSTSVNKQLYKGLITLYKNGITSNVEELKKVLKRSSFWNKTNTPKLIAECISSRSLIDFEIDADCKQLQETYNQRLIAEFLQKSVTKVNEQSMVVEEFTEKIDDLKKSIQYDTSKDLENSEVLEQVLQAHDKAAAGDLQGIQLGYANLSKHVLLEDVDVMVVGARPAMGKTAFAISTARNLAAHGFKIALFCIEMSDQQLVRRLSASIAKIDSKKIRLGKLSEKERDRIAGVAALDYFNNIKIYTGAHSVADISAKASALKHSEGLDLIIVDYLQKVTSSLSRSASETERVKQVSNDLKQVTQYLKVPQIQLAQLLKSSGKDGKRPVLSDLKQTGDIEQDASIVSFLHRPEYYGHTELEDGSPSNGICEFIIGKNREGGTNVIRNFKFSPWYSDFTGIQHPDDVKEDTPF